MYVCMCNGYRDSELRELAERGVECAVAAYETLGSGPNCGCCLEFAQGVIDEVASARRSRRALAEPVMMAAE